MLAITPRGITSRGGGRSIRSEAAVRGMMEMKLERDQALTTTPCLRLRLGRREWFARWDRRSQFAIRAGG
jgi:hypothetical protein